MRDDILALALEVSRITEEKVGVIDAVMRRANVLALNARLEAARAGPSGKAFSVVAQEMVTIAQEISRVSAELKSAIASNADLLSDAGERLVSDFRGMRYADLARTAVEIIDRNLYERSCDVRWWATEAALVEALTEAGPAQIARAVARLGTILRSYTVYLDIWIADRNGRVIATGRPLDHPAAPGADVSGEEWFADAMMTADGESFAVCDVARNPLLGDHLTVAYATAIRAGGEADGCPIGAIGIFFDWEPQARAVVDNIGLTAAEAEQSRVMILDADHRVIAASDGPVSLGERYPLDTAGRTKGFHSRGGRTIAFARTPGYETYRGLGWYGCIESGAAGSA